MLLSCAPMTNNNHHPSKEAAPPTTGPSGAVPVVARSAHSQQEQCSLQNATTMLYCPRVDPSCPATHIPSDLPVRLDDSASPSVSPPRSPPASSSSSSAAVPISIPAPAAPPIVSRSLGRSLGGSSFLDDAPLPIATVAAARPELRTWRITSSGLVSTMGAFLDKPKTGKENRSGAGQGLRYAMATMQGWRVDMEDAHVTELSMGDSSAFSHWSFFAVFDGHAGAVAAEYAASIIVETLKAQEEVQKAASMAREGSLCPESVKLLEAGLQAGFLALDEKIREKLDNVLGKDRSGSTAVCAILTPSHVVLANLGDSRAVLSRQETPTFGTNDHKPSNEKERQRIINAGGSVMIQRINGSLAVSRALGDFEYKCNSTLPAAKQQVSPLPDVYTIDRQISDEYLILACDGIYDVMSNDELCAFVHSRLEVTREDGLTTVCNQVLDACLQKGSRDNMTLLLVCFEGAPERHEERAAEDEKQMAAIRSALIEIIEESLANGDSKEELCVEYVLRTLNSTRPEAIPHDGYVRLLVRSIAEAVLAEHTGAESPSPGASSAHDGPAASDASPSEPPPASPGIPAQ